MICVVIFAFIAGACGEAPTLLVAQGAGVSIVNSTHNQLVIPTSYGARAVDFDYRTQVIYAMLGSTRGKSDVIVRLPLSDLQTTEKNKILKKQDTKWCSVNDRCSEHFNKDVFWEAKEITKRSYSATVPGSLVFDWVQNKLFWIHTINETCSKIYSAPTHDANTTLVVDKEIIKVGGSIKDLELDPYEQKLFFLQTKMNELTVQSYSITSGKIKTVHKCIENDKCFNARIDIHKKRLTLMKHSKIGIVLIQMDYEGVVQDDVSREFVNLNEFKLLTVGTRILNGKFFWIKNTNGGENCIQGQKPNVLFENYTTLAFSDVVGWRAFDRQAQTPPPDCAAVVPACPPAGCCRYREQSDNETECAHCQPQDVIIAETNSDLCYQTPSSQLNTNQPDASITQKSRITDYTGNSNVNKGNSMTLLYWLVATIWISLMVVYFVVRRKMKNGSYTTGRTEDETIV